MSDDQTTESDSGHVTLFRGAADNPYFTVYFQAEPVPGAADVACETLRVDLRPERNMSLHVEVYNPQGTVPLVITPGGMGECDGFRGFARNVAAAAGDLRVVIWDRRNMGRSEVDFGTEPLTAEEAEDLHVLVQRLELAPAAFYGMSSGARSNLVLAERYPQDMAALIISPLTGGPLAAERLPGEYYLKYLADDSLSTIEALTETPLWSAYMDRNEPAVQSTLLRQNIADFLAAMKRSGDFLAQFAHHTALGMTDERLAALQVPATLLLHHGRFDDPLHPITNTRAATTLMPNCRFEVAPTLESICGHLLPFVREHTPSLG